MRPTTSPISQRSTSMMTSVLTMVTTPLKSCVNPRSKPSEISVTSVMTRLKMSPLSLESRKESGTFSRLSIDRFLMSRTVRYVSFCVKIFASHSLTKITATTTAIATTIQKRRLKSTSPLPTIQSTPFPARTVEKSAASTLIAEKNKLSTRYFRLGLMNAYSRLSIFRSSFFFISPLLSPQVARRRSLYKLRIFSKVLHACPCRRSFRRPSRGIYRRS